MSIRSADLATLAAVANQRHKEAEAIGGDWLMLAVVIGESLIEAQRIVPAGRWQGWVEENLDFRPDAARLYIRVAFHKKAIEGSPSSLVEALTLLRGLPSSREAGGKLRWPAPSKELLSHVRHLRAAGASWGQIGGSVGVAPETAHGWVDPDYRSRRQHQWKQTTRRARRARSALEREEKDELVRRSGGSAAAAYASTRKALQEVDKAISDAEDPDVRRGLNDAMSLLHRAEDAIVAAIRAERVTAAA